MPLARLGSTGEGGTGPPYDRDGTSLKRAGVASAVQLASITSPVACHWLETNHARLAP